MKAQTSTSQEHTFTVRIYLNEYTEEQLRYISEHYTISYNSAKVMFVEVTGGKEEADKLESACFKTDEQFKAIYPDFLTPYDRLETSRRLFRELAARVNEDVTDTLLEVMQKGMTPKDSRKLLSYRARVAKAIEGYADCLY
jgi:hypothetical protein